MTTQNDPFLDDLLQVAETQSQALDGRAAMDLTLSSNDLRNNADARPLKPHKKKTSMKKTERIPGLVWWEARCGFLAHFYPHRDWFMGPFFPSPETGCRRSYFAIVRSNRCRYLSWLASEGQAVVTRLQSCPDFLTVDPSPPSHTQTLVIQCYKNP